MRTSLATVRGARYAVVVIGAHSRVLSIASKSPSSRTGELEHPHGDMCGSLRIGVGAKKTGGQLLTRMNRW